MREQDIIAFKKATRAINPPHGVYILVRETNPLSLKWIGKSETQIRFGSEWRVIYWPKPIHCKAKTADSPDDPRGRGGLVVDPFRVPEAFRSDRPEAEKRWMDFKSNVGGPEFDIVDDHRIVITLKEPHAPFEMDLGMGILPRHICEGHDTCPGDPVGAGPFQYRDRQGGLQVEFERFEDHFDGSPSIERLVFRVIRDDNARVLALLGNTADLVQNAVSPLMMPVVEDADGLQIQTAPSFRYTYLGFNLEHPILGDEKVRRAIAHAINREEIIEYKFGGAARASTGLFVPEHWVYEGDVDVYEYDPDRARQLLDEAGWTRDGDEYRFELEFKVSANNFRRSLAQLIGQQLGEVGIYVRVRAYEWGTFFDDIRSRNFEVTTLQWPSVLEPNLLRWIFHSDNVPTADARAAGANRGAYKNERVDELLDKGQRETDREKRKKIYSEIQQILARELPYISLWHEDNVAVLREGTEGYYTTPNARYDALRTVVPAPRPE